MKSMCLILCSIGVFGVPVNLRSRQKHEYPQTIIASTESIIVATSRLVHDHTFHAIHTPTYSSETLSKSHISRSGNAPDAPSVTFAVQNMTFKFTCQLPPQTDPNLSKTRETICERVQIGLANTAQRLQQWIVFQTPVKISMTFGSNCLSQSSSPEEAVDCKWDKLLGAASPSAWHELAKDRAIQIGLDSDYVYPSSLLKQYTPNDLVWESDGGDISAFFNSDAPWWFPTADNPLGEGSGNGGSYGSPLPRTRTREFGIGVFSDENPDASLVDNTLSPTDKIYDFEQTAAHEIMHGLGFMSSWGSSVSPDSLLPGSPQIISQPQSSDTNAAAQNLVGLAKSNIFDKTLAHLGANVMMRDYAAAMREESLAISRQILRESPAMDSVSLLAAWNTRFQASKSFQLSRNLYAGAAVTPMQLAVWFQDGKGAPRFAILYTPRVFAGGSSLSHLDATLYGSSGDYLMRPFCSSGSGIGGYTPSHPEWGVLGEATTGILRQMGYVIREV